MWRTRLIPPMLWVRRSRFRVLLLALWTDDQPSCGSLGSHQQNVLLQSTYKFIDNYFDPSRSFFDGVCTDTLAKTTSYCFLLRFIGVETVGLLPTSIADTPSATSSIIDVFTDADTRSADPIPLCCFFVHLLTLALASNPASRAVSRHGSRNPLRSV